MVFKSKPVWLSKKVSLQTCRKVKELLRGLSLHTVCEESLCPNISECFSKKTATFMILGDICTRGCRYCGVRKGVPVVVDKDEPIRVKEAVKKLGLNYVVLTSPTRDDLPDGGASIFCRTIREIMSLGSGYRVEVLIPDFLGNKDSLEAVAGSGAAVIAHNMETVPSLYIKVRKGASYSRSLKVLSLLKEISPEVKTKSGLMLGLGETKQEVIDVMKDLTSVRCDFITLGQYLPPSLNHYPLKKYIKPEEFLSFENDAVKLGFKGVKSSPYTRSSYMAKDLVNPPE
ncbi:MAG: lipoyl synthase [Candidatus Omnitrophica bacterium]|nr:lipoyl synthase [Candidatus Omnitrophota bacterium]MDD5430351.1 lipoyl synthase [Candidatus Omnitrophota bacterium]